MKTVIVLPTYNEKENIRIIIPQIEQEFKKIKNHNMHILVVDDNSPDRTADEVRKFQKKFKNIHLITGEKKGLGVAYIRGIKHAIKSLKAEVIFEMDADLSHPPSMLPDFMKEIDNGNDFVIGSRYVPGGDTPDWPLRRKMISAGGNFFARVVGGLFKVHDCTSGYRAITVSALKKIDFNNIKTKGYGFMVTLLYELLSTGAKVKELPLIFYDRKIGETKIRRSDIIEFFLNAFRLRIKSSANFLKFATVGGTGILVNLGVFSLAKMALFPLFGLSNLALLASSLLGDELSIINNFVLNNMWTFKNKAKKDPVMKKLLKFHVVSLSSVLINNSILFALSTTFGVYDVLAKLIGILIAFTFNYYLNFKWTWGQKLETANKI
jgi:dolichol-phosphate mannosyltransferase